jgi:ribonucleoside-triphosphate reductase
MLKSVVKRSGAVEAYNREKICAAIAKAFEAVGKNGVNLERLEYLTGQVEIQIEERRTDGGNAAIEEIQDIVETVLIEARETAVAKAYILYRAKHEAMRDARKLMQDIHTTMNGYLDIDTTMDGYLRQKDWRVNENANVNYSLGGLILHNSGTITANYWLKNIYSEAVATAHRNADFHIHDLSMFSGYCAGWSLRQLIAEGLGGVADKITSKPAKHLSTLMQQAVNFLGCLQNEWAGAQAFSSFDTYIAPFVKADKLSDREVKQCLQSFVFGVNTPSRWGSQAPFTNITLDWVCPTDLCGKPAVVGGVEVDFTYGDCASEMDRVNRLFIELMIEGDADGRGFQYPIPTYNITPDFNWDGENIQVLFEMTSRYGTPYFQNFVNSDLNPDDVRSMCPLLGTTVVWSRFNNEIRLTSIQEIVDAVQVGNADCEVWTPNGWAPAKPVQTPMTDVYRITLSNGDRVFMGENHLQPTKENGILKAKDLTVGMWLPYSKAYIEPEEVLGSPELGFAVGLYLGCGCADAGGIRYSLASGIPPKTESRATAFWRSLGCPVHTHAVGKTRSMYVGYGSYGVIARYVSGDGGDKRDITQLVYNSSVAFREGLIEGCNASGGAQEQERIYIDSPALLESLQYVFVSLGRKAWLVPPDNCRANTPIRCLAYDEISGSRDFFTEDAQYRYYHINMVENLGPQAKQRLFCFEMAHEPRLFTLGSGLVTHNCRLQLDKRELRKRGGGLFGSDELTGSLGVVTINLPRIGYLAKDEPDFFKRLEDLMALAKESLIIKRKAVNRLMESGLFPYTRRYLKTLDNHFNTIGLVGMNEALRNFMGSDVTIATDKGRAFALSVLMFMRNKLADFQEETGELFNLEGTPAESTSYRLARHDKKQYPSIITAGADEPYYTNSTQLPVMQTEDIFDALEMQEALQSSYTGGTIFHVFLGEAIEDWRTCRDLVKAIAHNYRVPYFTISPTFSVCPIHGYLVGEHFTCPKCKDEKEVELKRRIRELENEREKVLATTV